MNYRSIEKGEKDIMLSFKFNPSKFTVISYDLTLEECHFTFAAHHIPVQNYKQSFQSYNNRKKKSSPYHMFFPLYIITTVTGKRTGGFYTNLSKVGTDPTDIEKVVYIGKTIKKGLNGARFVNGHLATQKLTSPEYDGFFKRIYLAHVELTFTHYPELKKSEKIPLEGIKERKLVEEIVDFLERYLIFNFNPNLNSIGRYAPKVNFKWDGIIKPTYIKIKNYSQKHYTGNSSPLFNQEYLINHQTISAQINKQLKVLANKKNKNFKKK